MTRYIWRDTPEPVLGEGADAGEAFERLARMLEKLGAEGDLPGRRAVRAERKGSPEKNGHANARWPSGIRPFPAALGPVRRGVG